MPDYDKVAFATIGIQIVGLEAIRWRCANFARWLERLEGVASTRHAPIQIG